VVLLTAMLAAPALAQEAVHWHNDLESAKTVAKQTGRLVLVHFWTPTCGPCMALNQNVFNQPGVASAIETQFVPVKLNADENSATATWYGITRVPTDVIVTPDGQMIAKLISPPTPAAYVAEMTAAAGKYSSRGGQAFAKAAAGAPVPSGLNSAYAGLQVSPSVPLAVSPQQQQSGAAAAMTPATLAAMTGQAKSAAAGRDRLAAAQPTAIGAQLAAPQIFANPAVTGAVQPPITPVGVAPATTAPFASASVAPAIAAATPAVAAAAPPKQVNNPYAGLTPAAQQPVAGGPPPQPQQPLPSYNVPTSPTPAMPMGYDRPPLQAATMGVAVSSQPSQTAAAAVAQPAANGAPDARQLPPGAPPLGFDGYCPVSMRNTWKWVAGDPRYGVVHRGHTYWFAGPAEQKQFWTDPDRYTPALSGIDPVLKIDHQQDVPGKREHSLDYDGMFYMFASEATLQQFTANPQRYSTSVRQAMGIPRGRLVR
jgi:YHS domain-containing protein/thiol-disulfide isomerase/thioredoxin